MSDIIEVIDERYEVLRRIGRGGQGQTFLAVDRQTGQRVAVKELDLEAAADWKAIELFEREANALKNLDHRAIPDYVDAFHIPDEQGQERFFLVQEFIDGQSLRDRIDEAGFMAEDEARRVAEQLLDILIYLQSLSPPIVHRDIKPSNIMCRGEGVQDCVLVDFGAVQTVMSRTVGGSTIVGTSGYMPPEQLMGRAVPATDLYALGATIVYLMSGTEPSSMVNDRLQVNFAPHIQASPSFARFLSQLLEPVVEKRVQRAVGALALLEGRASATPDFKPPTPAPQPTANPGRSLAFTLSMVGVGVALCPALGWIFSEHVVDSDGDGPFVMFCFVGPGIIATIAFFWWVHQLQPK